MLLDTSGLLCMHHHDELHHAEASALYDEAGDTLTHNYVLAEFVALAHTRRLPRRPALAFMAGILENPEIEVVWVDAALHQSAMRFLQQRLDKSYSLCDAVSFQLMSQRGIFRALTTDHHFEQAGFVRLLK